MQTIVVSGNKRVPAPPASRIAFFVIGTFLTEFSAWSNRTAGIRILGFAAPGWIEQLYVAPDRLGQGIGSRLVDLAKTRSPDGLTLWTFQVNERARRFYERHGFVAVELTDGSGNEERQPDVRYEWKP